MVLRGRTLRTTKIRLRAALAALATVATAVGLTLGGGAAAQASTVTLTNGVWYSGAMKSTQEIDCSSMIWGAPYAGTAIMAYASVEVDMDRSLPKAGSVFYAEISMGAAAMPCGGQGVVPGFELPPGVQLAVSSATPLAVNGKAAPANLIQANCLATGVYCIQSNTVDAPVWAGTSGNKWAWLIPLKSSTPQNMTTFQAYMKVISGGSGSGVLSLTAPMNVFGGGSNVGNGSTPTDTSTTSPNAYRVAYPQPSTQAVNSFKWVDGKTYDTKYGVLSRAYLYTNGKAGTYYVRRAATAGALDSPGQYESSQGSLPTNADALTFGSDWNVSGYSAVQPGVTYYWKVGFQPSGGSLIWGAAQSFTAPEATECYGKPVTVFLSNGQTPTKGNDVILGTQGNDVIHGGGGNDIVCGMGGNDLITGDAGDDFIIGGPGNDTLFGDVTVKPGDPPSAVTGDDVLVGDGYEGAGGGSYADKLDGGPGNDLIEASEPRSSFKQGNNSGYGDDIVKGGSGTDTLSYELQGYDGAAGGVNVNLLLTAQQSTGNAGRETISEIENLTGSPWPDNLKGNGGNNVLSGLQGINEIRGDGGIDTVDYSWLTTKTADPTYPGVKFAWIEGTTMSATFGSGNEAGTDHLSYIAGMVNEVQPEVIIGSKYADLILGDDRDGTIKPGLGDDRVDGKGGSDTVSYSGTTKAIKVDLVSGRASGGAGSDRLVGIENATGGSGSDRLYGSSGANKLLGSSGNDTIDGRGGNDWLDGGSGTDTLSYASASRGVVVSLAKTGAQYTGSSTGKDTVRSFDNLTGSRYADKLYGNSHANTISGGAGSDKIYGSSGSDRLYGSSGNDSLSGSSGTDRCSGGTGRDSGSSCEVRSSIP